VIIPSITNIRFSYILNGIDSELSKYGYNMLLCVSDAKIEREAKYLSYLSHNHSDGIILATVDEDDSQFRRALDKGKKIVCINNLPNAGASYDAVTTDNIGASEMAVNYLYNLGHRRIALIAGRQSVSAGRDRLLGYRRTLEKQGILIDEGLIRIGDFEEKCGYDAMRGLMEQAHGFTAVYITNASMTVGAVKAIIDSGKKVGDDISVVGFDLHDPTGFMQPKITTICQQNENIGKYACRQLLDNIRGFGRHTPRTVLLPPELVVRESCKKIQ
jgi:DNA-binding LacI/PurR family transcriptional regulator